MKITRAACLILLIGFQGALARDLPAQVGPNESELNRHGYYQNRTGSDRPPARQISKRANPGGRLRQVQR